MNPTEIIQLCYGLPGVVAYFLIIYALVRVRRVLNRSFIVIFSLIIVVNIATWINSWLNLRLLRKPAFFPYFAWVNERPIFGQVIGLIISSTYYAQNVCLLLLTIDRFTVIWAMALNTKAMVACILPPDRFLLADVGSGYESSHKALGRASLFQLAFGICVFIFCCSLNVLSLYKLIRLRKLTSMSKESNFFVISFCIFLSQMFNLIIVVVNVVFNMLEVQSVSIRPFFRFLSIVGYFTSDSFSIGPAFFTILLPSPIRRFLTKKVSQKVNKLKDFIKNYSESSISTI